MEGKGSVCDHSTSVFPRSLGKSGPNWKLCIHTVQKTCDYLRWSSSTYLKQARKTRNYTTVRSDFRFLRHYEHYVLNYGTWRRVLCEIPRRLGQYIASKFRYRKTGRHNPKDTFASHACACVGMSTTQHHMKPWQGLREVLIGVTGTSGIRTFCTSSVSPEKRKCPHLVASVTRWCVVVGR